MVSQGARQEPPANVFTALVQNSPTKQGPSPVLGERPSFAPSPQLLSLLMFWFHGAPESKYSPGGKRRVEEEKAGKDRQKENETKGERH